MGPAALKPMKSALVSCSDSAVIETIRDSLTALYCVEVTDSVDACLARFSKRRYDVTFVDMDLLPCPEDEPDYRQILSPFRDAFPSADIVLLARGGAVREAVRATKAGAANYLTIPLVPEEIRYALESIEKGNLVEAERDYLREEFWRPEVIGLTRTRSPIMKEVFDQLRLVAPTRTTVLLVGETGTGKSLLARLIHQHSHRSDGPFVSVHCGAIPETLIESELFGHEKGAFTGAIQRKLGKFEIANGGTIFLDEVATLTPAAQIKLLQVLQDKTFQRVGGETTAHVDIRIIAATNLDLKRMCEEGTFRTDLFYRLSVFPISIPPLRSRGEDIPGLVEAMLQRFPGREGRQLSGVEDRAIDALQHYSWPGNVRELENVIERATILECGPLLSTRSLPPDLVGEATSASPSIAGMDLAKSLHEAQVRAISHCTKRYLDQQLARNRGRIDATATAAGISPRHLHGLMKRHGLRKEEYRTESPKQSEN